MHYWIFDEHEGDDELTGLPEITRCIVTGQPLGHATVWHWTQIDGHDVRYACNSDAPYDRDAVRERIKQHAIEHGYLKVTDQIGHLPKADDAL